MTRSGLVFLVTCLMVVMLPVAASADSNCNQDPPPAWCLEDVPPPVPPDPLPPPDPDDPVDPDTPPVYEYWGPAVSLDPDGANCWTIELKFTDTVPPPFDSTYQGALEEIAGWDQNGTAYDVCPQLIMDLAGGAAAGWWTAAWLPDASLEVDPGYAVAGLRSYLEVTHGPTPDPPAVATPFGSLEIIVDDPAYRVQWCGSCPVESAPNAGGPYPHGEVTHVYTDAGVATITWWMDWSARVVVSGIPGSFPLPDRTEDESLTLTIESRQAVVDG